jgi:hypothetical protein
LTCLLACMLTEKKHAYTACGLAPYIQPCT